jgi:hypothetical protein
MCESQNGHLFLIKRIHTYRTHFEQVELRSHDALPTLKNFSCPKRNKNLDYIKMIQQVPRVLLYNMIYISKKEELLIIIIKPPQKKKLGRVGHCYTWHEKVSSSLFDFSLD